MGKCRLFAGIVMSMALVGMQGVAHAVDKPLDGASNTAYIGMADVNGDGTSAKVAVMCWRDSFGAEILTRLRSDLSTGGMNQSINVRAGASGDTVIVIRTSGYTPGTTADCSTQVTGTWDAIVTNGYTLDIRGEDGNDYLEGPGGSVDTLVVGGTGIDYCYNYSSVGDAYGNEDADAVVSDTTGGSDTLSGNAGDDCLWDTSNSVASAFGFDCGTDISQDYYQSGNSSIEINCETSTSCCGLC